jgi:hypothetical protein
MDLDAVIARRPQVVLVDELAHTNAEGSRHPKRWLDVEEILNHGIDVYTTVNIQHIESLNDVVAQITRVRVRETVPDAVFDRADAVELVDLTPGDLIQRLEEGKVYVPKQARRALEHFFSPANLTALRELALRRTAERVDEQCTELSPEERREIAAKVAVAAIRFAILRVGSNKNVIFDWESSLSFTGDTGPYVQYSCARISSILRKFGEVSVETGVNFPIETDAEWALVTKLASFPDVVASCVGQRSCAPIAQFALDTARTFTTFYHECPVLGAETDAQRQARAQVCAATRTTLANALNLLGIEALQRM